MVAESGPALPENCQWWLPVGSPDAISIYAVRMSESNIDQRFCRLGVAFVVYYNHSTVGHRDLFDGQAIVSGGWVVLDGPVRAI